MNTGVSDSVTESPKESPTGKSGEVDALEEQRGGHDPATVVAGDAEEAAGSYEGAAPLLRDLHELGKPFELLGRA